MVFTKGSTKGAAAKHGKPKKSGKDIKEDAVVAEAGTSMNAEASEEEKVAVSKEKECPVEEKTEEKIVAKTEEKPKAKPKAKTEVKPKAKTEEKSKAKTEEKPIAKTEGKTEEKTEAKVEEKTEAEALTAVNAATAASKEIKKRVRKAKKKIKHVRNIDKPRRPLSAYNLFFRVERVNWLQEKPDIPKDENLETGERKVKSRLFESMAKEVGKRWQELDPSKRQKFVDMAKEESDRYREEMTTYRKKKVSETLQQKAAELQENLKSPKGGKKTKKVANGKSDEMIPKKRGRPRKVDGGKSSIGKNKESAPSEGPVAKQPGKVKSVPTGTKAAAKGKQKDGIESVPLQNQLMQQLRQPQPASTQQWSERPGLLTRQEQDILSSGTGAGIKSGGILPDELGQFDARHRGPANDLSSLSDAELQLLLERRRLHERRMYLDLMAREAGYGGSMSGSANMQNLLLQQQLLQREQLQNRQLGMGMNYPSMSLQEMQLRQSRGMQLPSQQIPYSNSDEMFPYDQELRRPSIVSLGTDEVNGMNNNQAQMLRRLMAAQQNEQQQGMHFPSGY